MNQSGSSSYSSRSTHPITAVSDIRTHHTQITVSWHWLVEVITVMTQTKE